MAEKTIEIANWTFFMIILSVGIAVIGSFSDPTMRASITQDLGQTFQVNAFAIIYEVDENAHVGSGNAQGLIGIGDMRKKLVSVNGDATEEEAISSDKTSFELQNAQADANTANSPFEYILAIPKAIGKIFIIITASMLACIWVTVYLFNISNAWMRTLLIMMMLPIILRTIYLYIKLFATNSRV